MNTPHLDKLMKQATQANANNDKDPFAADDLQSQVDSLFATHGPALVAVLKTNLEVLKGCEFAMKIFLPDSKFVAQEGLNRIQPAIETIETLLHQLDQEATCQK